MSVEHLGPPQFVILSETEREEERRVSNWITEWDFQEDIDVGIIVVPWNTSTMLESVLAESPNNMRRAMVDLTTVNSDYGVDVQDLKVRYIGDMILHQSDIDENIRRVSACFTDLFQSNPSYLPLILGGAGAVTWLAATTYAKATGRKFGVIQFDARSDMQSMDEVGPTDFTPIRAILEADAGVQGRNVAQIGLHGFVNTLSEQRYAQDHGVTAITAREVHKEGIEAAVEKAVQVASQETDAIYVTVDGNVLDITYAYRSNISTPGGLTGHDMMEAMYILGTNPDVKALDFVDIFTYLDDTGNVARIACNLLMAFLAGYHVRKQQAGG